MPIPNQIRVTSHQFDGIWPNMLSSLSRYPPTPMTMAKISITSSMLRRFG